MKTKGQRRAEDRRLVRHREKNSDVPRSSMMGNVWKRRYGGAVVDK
jgi:hypothetical protein